MHSFLSVRRREPEWMDRADADPRQLRHSLRFLRRINSLLGYTRSTIHHLERFSHRWRPDEKIRILDVGTGSADIPRAILRWGDARGFDLEIVGVDLHADTARAAAEEQDDPRLRIIRGDALRLPFDDASFDYAICGLFLHHLSDEEADRVLAAMGKVARRGIIVGDLLRRRRAYAWIRLLSLFANPMVRHDGPVSVAQAFTEREVLAMRDRAGVGFARFYHHFGHRFVLAGERREAAHDLLSHQT